MAGTDGRLEAMACVLALAACTNEMMTPPPPPPPPPADFLEICREELMLTDEQCAEVEGWRLPDTLPPARGNVYADDPVAADLGERIFYDDGFAAIAGVSCSTCHLPDLAFQDGLATSEVIPGMPVGRNSPSLLNAAWNEGFYFWDGRADSLWSQPLFAFENEIEMATTRLAIAHRIGQVAEYAADYESVFGALPELEDGARFPATGKPGDPAWEAMSDADRDAVNRVVANVGKALEAFMRTIASGPSDVDRYIGGVRDALSEDEKRGLVRFMESDCGTCHYGPMLVDPIFHQVSEPDEDRGRAAGIEILLASPFNSLGPYFDAGAGEPLPLPDGPRGLDEHAFRTPTMRNVIVSAPYRHDGSRDLESILAAPGPTYMEGDEVVIAAFLDALTGDPPAAE